MKRGKYISDLSKLPDLPMRKEDWDFDFASNCNHVNYTYCVSRFHEIKDLLNFDYINFQSDEEANGTICDLIGEFTFSESGCGREMTTDLTLFLERISYNSVYIPMDIEGKWSHIYPEILIRLTKERGCLMLCPNHNWIDTPAEFCPISIENRIVQAIYFLCYNIGWNIKLLLGRKKNRDFVRIITVYLSVLDYVCKRYEHELYAWISKQN
jgi:hypothetical protein